MYCTSCGKQIPDDSKFCEECGASQAPVGYDNDPGFQPTTSAPVEPPTAGNFEPKTAPVAATAQGMNVDAAPAQKANNRAPLIIVIVVVAVLALAGIGFALSQTVFKGGATITFETQGGSTVAEQTVAAGDELQQPADPTKPEFEFNGWYADFACTKKVSFPYKPNGNTTLYAGWTDKGPDASSDLKAYAEKLYSAHKTVRQMATDINTVGSSYAARQSAYDAFKTQRESLLANLQDSSGAWTIEGVEVGDDQKAIESDLEKASDLLVQRLDYINEGYTAKLASADTGAANDDRYTESQKGSSHVYNEYLKAAKSAEKALNLSLTKDKSVPENG